MQHIENLQKHIDQGTLIRGSWRGSDAHGRETACLLAAMVPQCGIDETASSCPAEVMPPWLARLTPELDDSGSLQAWPGMVRRYAALAAQWGTLDAAAWQRVQYRFLAAVVTEARAHTTNVSVHEACDTVIALCNRVVETGVIDAHAFSAAAAEAEEAWAAATEAEEAEEARAAARAARAATWAAWAEEAEEAAREAAWEAAWAALAEAWAARAAARAATEAEEAEAAWAAAWDRITVALFEALESETHGRALPHVRGNQGAQARGRGGGLSR